MQELCSLFWWKQARGNVALPWKISVDSESIRQSPQSMKFPSARNLGGALLWLPWCTPSASQHYSGKKTAMNFVEGLISLRKNSEEGDRMDSRKNYTCCHCSWSQDCRWSLSPSSTIPFEISHTHISHLNSSWWFTWWCDANDSWRVWTLSNHALLGLILPKLQWAKEHQDTPNGSLSVPLCRRSPTSCSWCSVTL